MTKAYEILENYDWCKGHFATKENGDVCTPQSELATSFCAMGAIMRAYPDSGSANARFDILEHSIRQTLGRNTTATGWNDEQKSKEQVISKLKELNI